MVSKYVMNKCQFFTATTIYCVLNKYRVSVYQVLPEFFVFSVEEKSVQRGRRNLSNPRAIAAKDQENCGRQQKKIVGRRGGERSKYRKKKYANARTIVEEDKENCK